MNYVLNVLLLVIGFVALVKGADFFVSSSSTIARKFRVSPLVIGLTLVAFGTSLPELAVSFTASLTVDPGQTADIAMGNVIGSNIVNITLILGLTTLARPIKVSETMHKKEFPYLIFSSILILILSVAFQSDLMIVWWEGLILLVMFILYVWIMIKTQKRSDSIQEIQTISTKKSILLLVIGIAMVSLGGYMVTTGAKGLAVDILVNLLSMTETKAVTLVGLSIVAIGTSLPELVTSVVAAKKNENEIAFGNLIGSNIFNVLFILGLSSLVTPLGINPDVIIDTYLMLAITVCAVIFSITKRIVTKQEGFILVLIYILYVIYIVLRAFAII
ncbi:MAG TPA: calcium/sodium antiporter [Acholeplasmataceae bacterium]|nr:calcium/sodium antiporter [Acholeplasmataceae bacterium]